MSKMYVINVENRRSVKSLVGGLPNLDGSVYRTKMEAAKAIFDGAFEIFESEILDDVTVDAEEGTPEFDRLLNEAIGAATEAKIKDIAEIEAWRHDGVYYYINEKEVGHLYTGSISIDRTHLDNREPIDPISDGICEEDAEDALKEFVWNNIEWNCKFRLERAPWGWTCVVTDDDDVEKTSEYCWIADEDDDDAR